MNKPEKIEKTEASQGERDKTLNVFQRINLVQHKVTYVQKQEKKGMAYSVVLHDAVTAKVRPILVAVGIVYYPTNMKYTQSGNRTEVQLDLVFQNIDDKDDCMSVSCLGFGVDTSDKGPGKAVSYAVKYGLLKALGLETGDDADLGNLPYDNDSPENNTTGGDPRPDDRECINQKQIQVLRDLIKETNSDEKLFLKAVYAESIESIPAFNYEMAFEKLIAKKKAMKNATGK